MGAKRSTREQLDARYRRNRQKAEEAIIEAICNALAPDIDPPTHH